MRVRPAITFAASIRQTPSIARWISGVAVVACRGRDGPVGLLVSSLTGVSTEPPRILFCVPKRAAAHAALLEANQVCVSLLDNTARAEAERFAVSGVERFADGGWRLAANAPPVRRDALAAFSGPVHCRIDAGTHTVFILDVSHAEARGEAEPLVYFERSFRGLA